MKKVLVFTSKWIGLKCVDFLLTEYPDDDYLFFIMEPDTGQLQKRIEASGKKFKIVNDHTIAELNTAYADNGFDVLLNVWGGHIFKKETLAKAKKTLNIHPAYLPYCRGKDPVVWAIRYGLPAGVTFHEITEGVDEGPIIYQEEVVYDFPITGGALYEKVVERCWKSFCEQWPKLRSEGWISHDQKSLANNKTFKRKDLFQDQLIDADTDPQALALIRKIFAHDFGDYTAHLKYKGQTYAIKCSLTPKTTGE